jgi:serine/threonine protein kinase
MSVSLKQFIENLVDSGLMDLEEVRELRNRLPKEKRPTDGLSLARCLVEADKLTKYQASCIYKGRQKNLNLGNYVVLEQIGRGGMGEVFKARHRRMKRDVAIKVLSQRVTSSETRLRRFHREVEAVARLAHPNIVTAFDAVKDDNTFFLVMEFVNGKDMAAMVEADGPLPLAAAVDYIIQTARGLEYAHGEGVVHRDVKPHNLLVTDDGTVKVLDLGLVSLETDEQKLESSESLTANNQIIGTVDYMSPEQAEDVHHVDLRTDIYSLGCTLYRILTDKPPYSGKNTIQKLMSHRVHPIPSLRAERDDVPELLDRVFRRMVAKRPEDRYQSMGEVIEALETCTLALISIADENVNQTVETPVAVPLASPLVEDATTMDQPASRAILVPTSPPANQPRDTQSVSIQADTPSSTRRQRKSELSSPVIILLAVAGILALVALASFLSRPTQILIDWPINERPGFSLFIGNSRVDYDDSYPLAVDVTPGTHKVRIERPGYFDYEETVRVPRRNKVSITPLLKKTP